MRDRLYNFFRHNGFALFCFAFASCFATLAFWLGIVKALIIFGIGLAGFAVGWCLDNGFNPFAPLKRLIERMKDE